MVDYKVDTFTVDASGFPNITTILKSLPTTDAALEGLVQAPFLYLINSGEEAEGQHESQGTDEPKVGDNKSIAPLTFGGSWTFIGSITMTWAMGFISVYSL